MEVILVNLGTEPYEDSRQRLNASATKERGITKIISHTFLHTIKGTRFYRKNQEIFDEPRGAGYWLWKPYIIMDALETAKEGDIVVYSDCGVEIIASLQPLITICEKETDILLFQNQVYTNAQWTKRDCFIGLHADYPRFWNTYQVDAAFCLFKNIALTRSFVWRWLRACQDVRLLTDMPNVMGKLNLPAFIEHRHDQSILSILAQVYRLPLYRMPSQYGNQCPKNNSPYSQLINHTRKKAPGGWEPPQLSPLWIRALRKRWLRMVRICALFIEH